MFFKMHSLYPILILSLKISSCAVLLQTVPAIFWGWYLTKRKSKFQFLFQSLILLPLMLTPLVVGYFVLQLFHPDSWLGNSLQQLGVDILFNWKGAVIAVSIVSFPLYVQSVQIAMTTVPKKFEHLSLVLGNSTWQTFLKVILPLTRFGILRGALISFARNLGEFGATVVVVGIIPLQTETIPSAIFRSLSIPNQENKIRTLIILSIAFSLLFLFFIQWIEQARKKDWRFNTT